MAARDSETQRQLGSVEQIRASAALAEDFQHLVNRLRQDIGLSADMSVLAIGCGIGVCAIHFDMHGNILDIPINARVVGISYADLAKIPYRLAVAGGVIKAPAIHGALRSGLLSALVTDDLAARKVLEQI